MLFFRRKGGKMKHKDLSKRIIKREEYLYLLSALEDNVITEEQFYRLLSDNSKAKFIIEIMKLEDLKDKDQFFDKAISLDYICDCEKAIELFNKYPVYKTDIEMRDFILENQIYFEDYSLKLLQRRFLRENKEFVDNLYKPACCYTASENVFIKIEEYLETYGRKYDDDKNLRILNTCLSLERDTYIERFLKYLTVEGLTKEPMWLEYLKRHYEESTWSFTIENSFKVLEERGWLDKLTEKLHQIDKCEEETEKDKQFCNLYNNIRFLAEFKDEEKELFDNTFEYLTKKDEEFRLRVELEKLKEDRNWSDETLNEYYEAILSLFDNVRGLVFSKIKHNHKFITPSLIKSLKDVYYPEAERILLRKAIESGDTDYVESRKEYFDVEKLDSKFLLYLDVCKPSRKKLLAMRKMIEEAKSEYNGEDFVVKVEDYSLEEKPQQKKKSLLSLFKK